MFVLIKLQREIERQGQIFHPLVHCQNGLKAKGGRWGSQLDQSGRPEFSFICYVTKLFPETFKFLNTAYLLS